MSQNIPRGHFWGYLRDSTYKTKAPAVSRRIVIDSSRSKSREKRFSDDPLKPTLPRARHACSNGNLWGALLPPMTRVML